MDQCCVSLCTAGERQGGTSGLPSWPAVLIAEIAGGFEGVEVDCDVIDSSRATARNAVWARNADVPSVSMSLNRMVAPPGALSGSETCVGTSFMLYSALVSESPFQICR